MSGAAQSPEPSLSAPGTTQPETDPLERLFALLADADDSNWKALEDEIWELWSQSGSDAFDLLLERGRKAMDDGDFDVAIEHLSALTDHAPDFAEGWNARATAFYLSGRLGLSLDDIARVLVLEPRHFGALSGLGIILEELGDDRGALEAYRHSLAIHPQNPRIKEAVKRLEMGAGRDI
ncbi:tetratricopeptide repeat protein [Aliiroseovarius sp. Z3]|uniref:tetratricopeptide repeat protein n=1 Tax=Aliiroseovarius sp. Z3 TaxID=2811402 RepID=UPI0023B294E1|nr:tetratricopeptide repeat protein [Aliiroseovarius sp. Z3]MDE9449145.1 tetratricopeptide repeat protein [Aliiroseovarius sp. Z3]